MKLTTAVLLAGLIVCRPASPQFRDDFNGPSIQGWSFFTGDGSATIDLRQGDGFGSILVDSTHDARNIWWAVIKRNIASSLDLKLLNRPGHELRLEARLRVSAAPRRVNLSVNTQKTTDFHTGLMEYDLPDTNTWHTISMTTHGLEAGPGDQVNVQLALMDWGIGQYRVDVDYYKVDVVDAAHAAPDVGEPLPYRPPAPDPETFAHTLRVAQDSMIDLQFHDVNYNAWAVAQRTPVVQVDGTHFAILRWDFGAFAGKKAVGPGVLELTTHSVARTPATEPEFGLIRVVEILGGDPKWDQKSVSLSSLCRGRPVDEVIDPQLIMDVPPADGQGGKTRLVISRPVLQRLLDGRTLGIAIRAQGAVSAAFYALEHDGGSSAATLSFNLGQ